MICFDYSSLAWNTYFTCKYYIDIENNHIIKNALTFHSTSAMDTSFFVHDNKGLEYPLINLYIQAITSKRFDDTKRLKLGNEKVCFI